MRKSSWIILGVCAALIGVLWIVYLQSLNTSARLTQAQATQMLDHMKDAVDHKNVREIMNYVSSEPDTRVSHLNSDQLRLLVARSFRQSGHIQADYSGVAFSANDTEAALEFDLHVTQHLPEGVGDDYKGHITLHLKQIEIPHLLGLYHTKEWRIVQGETTGPNLADYGDY